MLRALRRQLLRTRARAVVHDDRIAACLDDTAAYAQHVLAVYRTSFPSVFGPKAGRRAGERTPESMT